MRRSATVIADKTCGRAAGPVELDPLNRNTLARRHEQFIGEGGTLADGGDDFHIEKRPPAVDYRSQTATADAKFSDSLQKPATTTDKTRGSEP